MHARRDFLQLAAVMAVATGFSGSLTRLAAQQKLTSADLLRFDAKGQVTLLHLTDIHAQLKPLYFRPPSENFGVGAFEGIPPHLVGTDFLAHFGIPAGSALAYAHTMVDYVDLARTYGRLGGLDRIATLVKSIRAERGDDKVLLLDGGDTWQGSYTSLKTSGQDMIDCMKLLAPDAMVGHWEFTYGEERVNEAIANLGFPFLGGNVVDNEFEEAVFPSTAMFEKGGVKVAVIGQAFPYTPISNPRWMFPKWSFGIRPQRIQEHVDKARAAGAEVVVLLSHNGCDVDQKLATVVKGIDVILTGHTHDSIPVALKIGQTLVLSSGSHGKYLGRIDLEVKGGRVVDYNSTMIPVFSDAIEPDREMAARIAQVRAPFEAECTRVIGKSEGLLYRRGNFNGTWDDLICEALIEERDAEISISPGFRWGTTLLPGQDITIDDLYTQTAMTYPNVYRLEFTGAQLKEILEDVCDNLFHKDPFYQQGGDMVRVGGMSYACAPKAEKGDRIRQMTLTKTGQPIEEARTYVVAGWASVNQNTQGPAIYDLMETYITKKKAITPSKTATVKVVGM
ncbi:MAG: thiosulfohydrolase SoxB [Hyphomicrobiaceae bacterium]|nr:thiosulfohydrolase SoxB [Hyphomicrobiaceae bacterium]